MPVPHTGVCGAPLELAWEWVDRVWDKNGEGLIEGGRVQCAAGHWYTVYGETVYDPFREET
jgi:hypothetical protein